MADAGLIVLVSFISPFRNERRLAREIAGDIDVHRGLRRHAARGLRGPRSQGPLRPGPPRRDQELYRHRQPVRGPGARRSRAPRRRAGAAGACRATLRQAFRGNNSLPSSAPIIVRADREVAVLRQHSMGPPMRAALRLARRAHPGARRHRRRARRLRREPGVVQRPVARAAHRDPGRSHPPRLLQLPRRRRLRAGHLLRASPPSSAASAAPRPASSRKAT